MKMNANELAIELEHYLQGEEYDRLVWEIPDLLRQQQAEINTLRNHGYKTQYELLRLEFLQQQAEIEALKKELERYADAIGEERGNKALRNDEIAKILTKVLDDCGLLKKANEK
jgi:Glu-tRNA(Gln) amidotransferase subunit E-like FAD-binding protein